jgi:hypothetical protein
MIRHDAAAVARQIGKTENWVRRNAHALPHSRAGKTYFWTQADLDDLIAALRVRPASTDDELRPFTGRRAS